MSARGSILKVTGDLSCLYLLAGDFIVFSPDGKPIGMIRKFDGGDADGVTEQFGPDRTSPNDAPNDAPDHTPDVISILDRLGRK